MYDNNMTGESLSCQLRSRRRQLGLSLAEIARRAGTSAPTLSRYENGWDRFEVGTLRKLADALDAELLIELRPRKITRLARTHRSRAIRRLARLFWDHKLTESDFSIYPVWIVERVLEYGDLDDLRTVRRLFGSGGFIDAVARARFASPKTRNFWDQILKLEGRSCTRKFSRSAVWVC